MSSQHLLVDVSLHAIELCAASRDEVANVTNVLHISMSLELGARIVSHLSLRRRTRNFFDLSVPDECDSEREHVLMMARMISRQRLSAFFFCMNFFSPSAIANHTVQVKRLHVPASEHSFLEEATFASLSSPINLLLVASY